MVYGRLDVYWPDGPSESYQLEKPTIAVGRSTGNDVALDATSVSRYHISLSYENQQIVLRDLDSVNGTYIDGERIKPNEPHVLRGGEEIQIGDLLLVVQPSQVEMPTQPILPEQSTQHIQLETAAFKIELEGPNMTVTPGAHVQAALTISNTGKEMEHYFVEVSGVPREWVRVDRAELELKPDNQAVVTINFKPLRRSESKPGEYPIMVRVRAKSTPDKSADAQMILTVRAYNGFGIALAKPRVEGKTPLEVYVHNQGNGTLAIKMSGRAPNNNLTFDVQPSQLALGPGERQRVFVTIRPRQGSLAGKSKEYPFHIVAQSQDAAHFLATVGGVYADKPLLSGLLGRVIGILAVFLVVAVIAIIALLTRPRPAEIVKFEINPSTPLIRNVSQKVTIAWQVNNASRVRLEGVDQIYSTSGNTIYEPTAGITFDGVPRNTLIFTLVATGDDGQDVQRSITVEIGEPACKTIASVVTRLGPGDVYQAGETLDAGTRVSPDRFDTGSQWFRLAAGMGTAPRWIPANAVTCDRFEAQAVSTIEASGIPPTPTPTSTPTNTPTSTYTNTPTNTATNTATYTSTPTYTPTYTPTNTLSYTPTVTNTPSNTPTMTHTPSHTLTATRTPTHTRTPSVTKTPTATPTLTPSLTPSRTAPPTLQPRHLF